MENTDNYMIHLTVKNKKWKKRIYISNGFKQMMIQTLTTVLATVFRDNSKHVIGAIYNPTIYTFNEYFSVLIYNISNK